MDLFADEATGDIIINYGETDIIQRQVDRQLMRDARWAVLSLIAAALFLRAGAGSTFLTAAGLFQILVRTLCCPPVRGSPRSPHTDELTLVHACVTQACHPTGL